MFHKTTAIWHFVMVVMLQISIKYFQVMGQQPDVPSSHLNRYHNASESPYGQWSSWTQCSRTCDVGISMRSRKCHKRLPDSRIEETPCLGESVDHKICKLQSCLSGTPDFRASQCSRFNGRVVAGLRAESWEPTDGSANPCELRCTAEGVVSGFGKVQDGTPCKTGVCLDGRCLKVGCDDRLGSGTEVDMCGLCGGRNSTCVHYKDIFNGQMTVQPNDERHSGYQEVTVFPVGSRNLEIRQRVGHNILAVRDHATAIWYNGKDHQEKTIAGTVLAYSRIDENRTEVLKSIGPITTKLYVLVLLRERNLGISYEFWLPLDNRHRSRHPPFTTPHPTLHGTTIQRRLGPHPNSLTTTQTTRMFTKSYHQAIPNSRSTPNYGPKRQGLFYAHFNYIHSRHPWESSDRSFTTPTSTTITQLQPLFVPRLNINYKTRKPIFDFYEKYRNISNYSPAPLLKKQDFFPPLRDSGVVQGHDGRESHRFNEVEYEDSKKSNYTKFSNPHSKWKYSFNNKLDGDKDGQPWTTPVSIAVLPLPEQKNYTKTRRGKRRGLKNQPTRPSNLGPCAPCQRVRNLTRHFCKSDFVIRAIVLGYEFLHGETRYELEVILSFKNTFPLLSKEYIWSADTCRCPKLRIGKEYVLMGRSETFRRNESRLLVDHNSFVRNYNNKNSLRLSKLKKEQTRKCSPKIS